MSRRRDQRGRRQADTSDRSKRILQISLVSTGVLLLLIAMVIAVGLPMGSSLLANDGGSGDNGGDTGGTQAPATTSTESKQTPQKNQTTTTTTEEQTTTEKQTTTTTQQTQTKNRNSGKLQVVKTKDRDGDGYVSNFNLDVGVDTTRNKYKNKDFYLVLIVNGQRVHKTKTLKPNPNGYAFNLDKSALRSFQSKQGTMRVKVKLKQKRLGRDKNLNVWSTRVKYEPKENINN